MTPMSAERLCNARVHEWLTPDIDAVVDAMSTTRVQLNSAAMWWFCCRLTAEQRAEILGEYVKVQARGRDPLPPADGPVKGTAPDAREPSRPRRRKAADRG